MSTCDLAGIAHRAPYLLIGSFVFLVGEIMLSVAAQISIGDRFVGGAFGALILSIPQLIWLTAVAKSTNRHVRGIALIGGLVSFGFAVWWAYAISSSTSSTAGVALIFWPPISAVIALLILSGVHVVLWLFSFSGSRRKA